MPVSISLPVTSQGVKILAIGLKSPPSPRAAGYGKGNSFTIKFDICAPVCAPAERACRMADISGLHRHVMPIK
jgi:hypothetical protein